MTGGREEEGLNACDSLYGQIKPLNELSPSNPSSPALSRWWTVVCYISASVFV
jgi:hypothetical protein